MADCSAHLVAGISLQDFFRKVGEKSETFKEYDKYGKPTGKEFTETKVIATLPSGGEVVIGSKNNSQRFIEYDFYTSLSFDGETSDQTFLELHYSDCDSRNLTSIIGEKICRTEDIEEIDTVKINQTVAKVKEELKEKFGYNGIIKLYLINYVSY